MSSPDSAPRKEREDTDARLLAERTKTDAELADKERAVAEEEDQVVDLARRRAEETLVVARQRADLEMATLGMTRKSQKEVAKERAAGDVAVAQERVVADIALRIEREEHQRALSALLSLEREATDDGLLIERAHADEVIATRDDFLGMVSHDLRTILGTIAMSAALLGKSAAASGDDAAAKGHVERIQRGTARMNRLVGDLLDVVSLEAGKLRVTPVAHDASLVVQEALEAYAPSFSAKGVALTTDSVAGSIFAKFDHDRILQILANLLSNALKFSESGGHVAMLLGIVGTEVRFSVTDTGAGIPPEQALAVFERFGQVTRDRRGHGLGLYIAKCIVEAHQGRIWVESPAAGGAALHFALPGAWGAPV